MILKRSALAARANLSEAISVIRRTLIVIAAGLLLSACVSFRNGPFVPVSGPFIGATQSKNYEIRQVSKNELRVELGEPAEIREHASADQWIYVSIRRRTAVERRGFAEKVTCQFVRDTYVFSFINGRVSDIATSSKIWQSTPAADSRCT